MKATVVLDQAGRLVLPKAVRDQLHVAPGDTLDLSLDEEKVTLKPRRATTPLQKERGVWVLRTGKLLTSAETNSVLKSIRDGRGT